MPIVESAAVLTGLTSLAYSAVERVAANRADAGIEEGWSLSRQGVGKLRACWDKLDLLENQVLQKGSALAHWKSVCHMTVFYARTHNIDIEVGLDALGAPQWLSGRFLKRAPGVLSAADQEALRTVHVAARERVAGLLGDSPLPASESDRKEDLDRLAELFADGQTGPRSAIELAYNTLEPACERLPETFRAFFAEHWFDLLAVNFQELVRTQPGLSTELHSRWLAEIRIELGNGKILGLKEWNGAFDRLIQALKESENRVIDKVEERTEAVLKAIDEKVTPQGRVAGTPDTTPMASTDYFWGRQKLLDDLQRALKEEGKASLWAEGGFGKTQAALRHVDLNRASYTAILWTDASTVTGFQAGYEAFAKVAGIAVTGDLPATLANVQKWLENNSGWLMVLDNVDLDEEALLGELRSRLPRVNGGHLLATTRHPSLADLSQFREIAVNPFDEEESIGFLKRRANREEPWGPAEDQAARALAERLGGLPLALEQAAAYVDETKWSFAEYLPRFDGIAMLELQKPRPSQYSLSVATTWRINFEKVETEHPASADILRASAWLAPAPIPLVFIEQGAAELGDRVVTALNNEPAGARALLAPLAAYSLIRRGPDGGTFWIHRLVAEVMRDRLGAEASRWREGTLLASAQCWPAVKFENWPQCSLLLPHALHLRAITPVDAWEKEPASIRLLNQCGLFLDSQGRYPEAEPLYGRALEASERVLGAEHPSTLTSVNNLAGLYARQGRYGEAEPLYVRALEARERVLGAEHPDTLSSVNNLAGLCQRQGRYGEAEPLYVRALEASERVLGAEHPSTLSSVNNLAFLYASQGRYGEAEPLYVRALEASERVLGVEHPDTLSSVNNLAGLYESQGRYGEAEPLYVRALEARERALGAEHPDTVKVRDNLKRLRGLKG